MANIERIEQLGREYDQENQKPVHDYTINHNRLCVLVEEHGLEAVSVATGLSLGTVQQHYRNRTGTAMIADSRLDRAEAIFAEM